MFSRIGVTELLIILAILILIFGPKNIPKLGKAFGQTIASFRAGQSENGGDEDDEGEETSAGDKAAPKKKTL